MARALALLLLTALVVAGCPGEDAQIREGATSGLASGGAAAGGAGGAGGAAGGGGGGGGGEVCQDDGDCPADTACRDHGCDATGHCSANDTHEGEACTDGCSHPLGCICVKGACTAASCRDGVNDGDETGVDCGGSCPPCDDGAPCKGPADCKSKHCDGLGGGGGGGAGGGAGGAGAGGGGGGNALGVCAPCTAHADCAADEYCDPASGACASKKADGQSCQEPAACLSASCSDGVCCDAPCGGACDACSVAAGATTDGVCALVGKGAPGNPLCEGGFACDGASTGCPTSCSQGDGLACVGGKPCKDAKCCDATCDADCQTCVTGTCAPVTGADDPDTCTGASTCDALGVCKKKNGVGCSTGAECATGHCTDAVCCDKAPAACAGPCEACNLAGALGACSPRPSTTVCRPKSDVCDLEEKCDGVGGACPADAVEPTTTTCRPSAGVCDKADLCDGAGKSCPADAKQPSTLVCRAKMDLCDTAETCDGVGNACPADAVEPSTTSCRPAADVCDAAESCDGVTKACPADAKQPATFVCRAQSDVCDVEDKCDGVGDACPADAVEPSTTTCRTEAGACDVLETCNGTAKSCPADGFVADGGGSAGGACNPFLCDGAMAGCPTSCATDADCIAGRYCFAGRCAPVGIASATHLTGTLTIAKPAGTAEGDVLFAAVAVRPETIVVTPPAGWTLIASIASTSAPTDELYTYYKLAGAGEPASYDWTFSAAHTGVAGAILTFRGLDGAAPVHASASALTSGTANTMSFPVDAPSVTTSVMNTMIVAVHSINSSGTPGAVWTPPAGMTEGVDISSDTGTPGESLHVAYAPQSAAGASGVKTAIAAGHDGTQGLAQTLALK
jgi:hypothetical protein